MRAYCLLVSIHALEPRRDKETDGRASPQLCRDSRPETIKKLYQLVRELEKLNEQSDC